MNEATTTGKQEFLDVLNHLEETLREGENGKWIDAVRELKDKLSQEQFQIVVMGEFKRGKSSFINALLGERLLPVSSVPLTSVVTVVRSGPAKDVVVEFLDGRTLKIAESEIESYVSEELNPANKKGVLRVVAQRPSALLKAGTMLVDTPGAGSVYRHNTEVTQNYLPQCDAVVLVLSADPPISETEVEFLHSIRRWAKKLFVVLNKIDYLSPPDLERSLRFTEKVVREAVGDPRAAVFPVSAKLALEAKIAGNAEAMDGSRFGPFVSALEQFLREEKNELLLASIRARAANVIENQLFALDLRLKAFQSTEEQWKAKSGQVRKQLSSVERKQYEFSRLYQAEVKDHIAAVEESLYEMIRQKTREATRALERNYHVTKNEPVARVREKLNKAFMELIEGAFADFLANQEPRWIEEFREITDRYLENTLSLVNGIRMETAAAFGVPQRPLSKPPVNVAPPAVWFVVEKVSIWSGGIQSMPTLRILRYFFWQALEKKIGETMDVNAGRLRYDYSRRMEQASGQVLELLASFFSTSIEALKQAATDSELRRLGASQELKAGEDAVKHRKAALTSILERLNACSSA